MNDAKTQLLRLALMTTTTAVEAAARRLCLVLDGRSFDELPVLQQADWRELARKALFDAAHVEPPAGVMEDILREAQG